MDPGRRPVMDIFCPILWDILEISCMKCNISCTWLTSRLCGAFA